MPRASIFGGSWINGSNAGSRYANLDYWPENSNENLGARGRCDDRILTRRRSRSRRSSTSRLSRLRWSAWLSCFGEHMGPAERGVAEASARSSLSSRGINFLGYRVWATHKLLRRDSVTRARRKIAAYRAKGDDARLASFLAAWLGHARFADGAGLIRSLGIAIEHERTADAYPAGQSMSAVAEVLVLPVVRRGERAEGVLVQANLDRNTHNKFRALADRYWKGDLTLCASELLYRAVLDNSRGGEPDET